MATRDPLLDFALRGMRAQAAVDAAVSASSPRTKEGVISMHTLKNWKARRAGGRITVTGEDVLTGRADKIVGVDVIQPQNGKIIATDKHGGQHILAA